MWGGAVVDDLLLTPVKAMGYVMLAVLPAALLILLVAVLVACVEAPNRLVRNGAAVAQECR